MFAQIESTKKQPVNIWQIKCMKAFAKGNSVLYIAALIRRKLGSGSQVFLSLTKLVIVQFQQTCCVVRTPSKGADFT